MASALHNHAGFLLVLGGARISRMWMVDALPEYSAEFWLSCAFSRT